APARGSSRRHRSVGLTLRNDPVVNRFMLRDHVDEVTFRREWLAVPDSDTDFSCVAEFDGQVVAMGFSTSLTGWASQGGQSSPKASSATSLIRASPEGAWEAPLRGLLTAAFKRLGLRRATASCNADNPASARVLVKAGVRREQHGIEDSWPAELGGSMAFSTRC
ncbi:MAG: GNAT family N-acetyltransferase, partial [Solirubrobacteraceae bacterium]